MKELQELATESVHLATDNVRQGGGPFGAIIVRNGEIIARGVNRVTANHDPTAHAEVMAIRNACEVLDTHQLDDCILITSCEPCPMCLGAAYWARVQKVYYIATKDDASAAGFDDSFIYKELEKEPASRDIPFIRLELSEYNTPFEAWINMEGKTLY
ncbi:MAG: nucleoside deaminase [Saprospiraceae bacterium]|nr:nucleoside deaminase [Saprospiraceae bacterium]